ncbi:coatomer epsilon subunit-domain-containing protein [Dioszegia hungarica]|uniref:Coatomer subunit epsilon n=1 Tax=Dioszegia hungarica TaxID=4972 RepID=A0AA38LT48_9TREE|nr:coatomer epsilon subunit-domain-containing protein [Dioszegia hungarica]XP_052941855.1 coatomer epsilon subunit-domain-containing protein [Dioszegia hungarica]KAI9632071.1 coatomer epsilon subunit-domain-containing protein [Dioszegia hungarica]KAI9632078.1 coatomer epsilon subunit-domain-containing protein [Dioszegia hungarica]
MEADSLYHVKQLFYQACITEASSQPHSPSDSSADALPRALYIARANLALSPPSISAAQAVLKPFLAESAPSPAAKAVAALATYLTSESGRAGVVDEVRDLVLEYETEEEGSEERKIEEGVVRVMAGTLFILEGEKEEAVATLTEGSAKTDLECLALLVQLLLSLDRRDLAQSTYQSAKKIGNDSTLIQAMEAWIGLKTGARPLHQSYYYFEELYQLPSGRTGPVLAGHAAAHLLLTHVEEAKADIQEALQRDGGDKDGDVLAVGTSLGLEGYASKLSAAAPSHPFALDLAAKSSLFDEAAGKFGIAA